MPEGATKLEELVGEGKKYKTQEDLAVSRLEADRYIAQLETETSTLREELAKLLGKTSANDTLEKLMTELANRNTNNNVPPGETTPTPKPADLSNQPQALTQEDIVKLIEGREAAQRETINLNHAMEQAKKVYGDKLDESLAARAAELGLDMAQIESIAKRSPAAFYNLIGLNRTETQQRPMARGGVTITPDVKPNGNVRNKAYYEGLKKEMGITKFVMDRDLQIQLHKDLAKAGDEWDS